MKIWRTNSHLPNIAMNLLKRTFLEDLHGQWDQQRWVQLLVWLPEYQLMVSSTSFPWAKCIRNAFSIPAILVYRSYLLGNISHAKIKCKGSLLALLIATYFHIKIFQHQFTSQFLSLPSTLDSPFTDKLNTVTTSPFSPQADLLDLAAFFWTPRLAAVFNPGMWPPPQAGYVTAIPWAAEVFIAGQELPNYSVPPGCSYVEAATAFVFSQPCKYFMAFLDLLKISSSHESTPLQTPGFRLLELFNFEVSKQSVKLCFSWLQFNTLPSLGGGADTWVLSQLAEKVPHYLPSY